ncbi:MAG: hypothetical protein IIB59_00885 [Planctomycetes bacterium]|nr:hypothetical protein [Planctomycetota bacterium]
MSTNRDHLGVRTALSISVWLLAATLTPCAMGQQPEPQPDAEATQAEPVEPAEQTEQTEPAEATATPAIVIEVVGRVDWALAGVSPLVSDGWTPVALADQLHPGTLVRTGLRSHVNLQFGETTIISVRSATYASIDQFLKSATTENVRIGLGYGTVRGGSTEGGIQSDVVVDSTVATLAKRGTEGWEMRIEPATGRFRISLAKHGLVDAIQKRADGRTQSRTVRPGEYATQANIANMWINQAIFDRNVKFFQATSMSSADATFALNNTRGFGEMDPGGGTTLIDLSSRGGADTLANGNPAATLATVATLLPALTPTAPLGRPEGNFGTGPIFRTRLPAVQRVFPTHRFFAKPRRISSVSQRIRNR